MLNVEPIEKGTVIDHIKAGMGAKVLKIMGIDDSSKHRVALMMNAPSKKMGAKDIVKIAEKIITEKEANIIALISPGATVNIINNSKVEKKYTVDLPQKLDGIGICPNPNCITNSESDIKRIFTKEGEDDYRCYFCERVFKAKELV
ncbi:MAG: aspartate carbamoyltransferase regulatory subunit [Candidatus Bilamarchaeaceae archaeon]